MKEWVEKRLPKILNNRLFLNGFWLYLLQFFNLVVPLLTIPYITRILGKESYGLFSIALNIVTYLQVIVEYGFGMSATRKVAIGESKQLNKIFTTVILGRFILLLCSIGLSFLYLKLNENNQILCMSFIILTICLLGYCVQMNWVFQGKQEMKYISIVNVLGRAISTLMIFLLVKKPEDIFLYSLLYSISPFISGFLGLLLAKKKYKLKFVKVKYTDVINELKDGFYVFTTQLSSKVFGSIGITFLGVYATSSTVGVFSAIQKIPNVLVLLWTPIAQIIYPIASKEFKKSNNDGYSFVMKIRRKVLPLFFFVAVFIGIFAKPLIQIAFGKEYGAYYKWLYPLLIWLLLSIENNFFGIQILLGSGHDKEYGRAFNIGVASTILLNFFLIRSFAGMGASVAPLLSELVLNIMLRKEIRSFSHNIPR